MQSFTYLVSEVVLINYLEKTKYIYIYIYNKKKKKKKEDPLPLGQVPNKFYLLNRQIYLSMAFNLII